MYASFTPSVPANHCFGRIPHPLVYSNSFVSRFLPPTHDYSPGTPSPSYVRQQESKRKRAQEARKRERETRRAAREARTAEQAGSAGGEAGGASTRAVTEAVAGGVGGTEVRKVVVGVSKEVAEDIVEDRNGVEHDKAISSKDSSLPTLPVQPELETLPSATVRSRSSHP